MIELYYAETPNGLKIKIMLEEVGLAYKVIPVNISEGDQFSPEFLAISPNNKIPAIVDHEPTDGAGPLAVFESGAILLYLADKLKQLIPIDLRGRTEVLKWLFWQVGGLGPMAGQNGHFSVYAPEKIPYAIDRYTRETSRLYGVLDEQLWGRDYIAGDYSIADIACYPWIVPYAAHGQDLTRYPDLKRWFDKMAARPAVIRAYEGTTPAYRRDKPMSEKERDILFGQGQADRKKS
ncbi:glutathione S-transferase N-terminal domain-containing protein [Leeia oryzae]|uniref:glutathione S-transferase N-terminal domain-containing protein n=1 Tax=Leeia oryzae TaxID=356662 RepID=UPI000370855F|nr:glutathione S-transferase N-terminal domain-containing protein [Leeia oryzae]